MFKLNLIQKIIIYFYLDLYLINFDLKFNRWITQKNLRTMLQNIMV